MDPDILSYDKQTPMQVAQDAYSVRKAGEKYLREMPAEAIAQMHLDPTMLFSVDDIKNTCPDCKKRVTECVCSDIDDALLDTLIQQVSVPNLAALYQKAQDQGLVKPMYHYQSNS